MKIVLTVAEAYTNFLIMQSINLSSILELNHLSSLYQKSLRDFFLSYILKEKKKAQGEVTSGNSVPPNLNIEVKSIPTYYSKS